MDLGTILCDLRGAFLPIVSFKENLGGISGGLGGILWHFGAILGGSWADLGVILWHFVGILGYLRGILKDLKYLIKWLNF